MNSLSLHVINHVSLNQTTISEHFSAHRAWRWIESMNICNVSDNSGSVRSSCSAVVARVGQRIFIFVQFRRSKRQKNVERDEIKMMTQRLTCEFVSCVC